MYFVGLINALENLRDLKAIANETPSIELEKLILKEEETLKATQVLQKIMSSEAVNNSPLVSYQELDEVLDLEVLCPDNCWENTDEKEPEFNLRDFIIIEEVLPVNKNQKIGTCIESNGLNKSSNDNIQDAKLSVIPDASIKLLSKEVSNLSFDSNTLASNGEHQKEKRKSETDSALPLDLRFSYPPKKARFLEPLSKDQEIKGKTVTERAPLMQATIPLDLRSNKQSKRTSVLDLPSKDSNKKRKTVSKNRVETLERVLPLDLRSPSQSKQVRYLLPALKEDNKSSGLSKMPNASSKKVEKKNYASKKISRSTYKSSSPGLNNQITPLQLKFKLLVDYCCSESIKIGKLSELIIKQKNDEVFISNLYDIYCDSTNPFKTQ